MSERDTAPTSSPSAWTPAASSALFAPLVQKALAYNHLTSVPPTWVINQQGELRDSQTGQLVNAAPPIQHSWLHDVAMPLGLAVAGTAGLSALTAPVSAAGAGADVAGSGLATLPSTAVGSSLATLPTGAATSTLLGTGATTLLPAATAALPTVGGGGGGALSSLGGVKGVLSTAGQMGNALSAIEAGRQQGRYMDATLQQGQDRNATDAARLNLQAPSYRASNAARGDILSNAQDFKWGAPSMVGNIPVPSSTGGLRPSIFSPQTKQLGALQTAQALTGAQTNGGNVAGVTPLPQPSALDSILSTAGQIGQLTSLIPYKKQQQPYNPLEDPASAGG